MQSQQSAVFPWKFESSPSLRALLMALVASVAIPLGVVGVYSLWDVVDEQRQHAAEVLETEAWTFAALLDKHIADSDALLRGISASSQCGVVMLAGYPLYFGQ